MGKSRRDALKDLARKWFREHNLFVGAVVQADQLGISFSKSCGSRRKVRFQRKQRAEEEAMKAPVKISFPLSFLSFRLFYRLAVYLKRRCFKWDDPANWTTRRSCQGNRGVLSRTFKV